MLLVIIGTGWLEARFNDGPSKGKRRLDDPSDHVRAEIEAAFRANIPVIPVLVGVTHSLPQEGDLPSGLTQLARLNAADAFSADFHKRADKLIERIEDIVGPVSIYRQLWNRWWQPN